MIQQFHFWMYIQTTYLYIYVHRNIIPKSQKAVYKCSLMDEWVNKMWHIHTMESFPYLSKRKITNILHSGLYFQPSEMANSSMY